MASFYLTKSSCVDDPISCPHCKQGYMIDWNTEYGDPLAGEYLVKCEACGLEFQFSCWHGYSMWAPKKA